MRKRGNTNMAGKRKSPPKKEEPKKTKRRNTKAKGKEEKPQESKAPGILFPSGSTRLNLQCSNSYRGAFGPGKIVNIIGDSSSGKTFLALTTLALAANDPRFDDYELIYDDVEEASEFDLPWLFGKKAAERMVAPAYYDKEKQEPNSSDTIEEFHYNIRKRLKKEKKFIYVLDSFDALSSEDDDNFIETKMKAMEKGNDSKGTYGLAKPRVASRLFQDIRKMLKESESLLIVVSQTRDNINPQSFSKKTRSGGRALEFYSTHIMWTAIEKTLTDTKQIAGKKKTRDVGVLSKVRVSKNKFTGIKGTVSVPITWNRGVDDVLSMVDWLIEEEYWDKKKGGIIHADDFKVEKTRMELVRYIENENLEYKLQRIIQDVWFDILEQMKNDGRKRRFE